MMIDRKTYREWKNQPILYDEDEWGGKYDTYGEMWEGEGYEIEAEMFRLTYFLKGQSKQFSSPQVYEAGLDDMKKALETAWLNGYEIVSLQRLN